MKRTYGIAGNGRASLHLQAYFRLLKIPFKLWHRQSGITPETALRACDTVFILLSDAAIRPFIAAHPFLGKKTLIHFSGSLNIKGAFAMHPFMPLGTHKLTLEQYRDIPFAMDPGISLKALVPEFKNPVFTIKKGQKPLYHALCALGANLPVLLWSRALRGLCGVGVPHDMVQRYFRASLENFIKDPEHALSGPIHRGDKSIVRSDIKALGRDPFAGIYSRFARIYENNRLLFL